MSNEQFGNVSIFHKASLYFIFKVNEQDISIYPKEQFTIINYDNNTYVTSWGYSMMKDLKNANIPISKVSSFKSFLKKSLIKLANADVNLEPEEKKLNIEKLIIAIRNKVAKYPDLLGLDTILATFLSDYSEKYILLSEYKRILDSALDELDINLDKPIYESLVNLGKEDKNTELDVVTDSYWYLFKTLKDQGVIEQMINPNTSVDNRKITYIDEEERGNNENS